MFLQWLAILFRDLPFLVLALAADAAAIWAVMCGAVAKNRIRKGIEEISGGNLEYRIDLKWLRGEERDIAEKINNIGSGLNKAVDEAMRNERLKTDLITNVSHDIKTPLTSIINYVDILKRSNIADEKIRGYLDILESKAQRLKTLTEDVVEASKVSSGNITLEYMDMDLRELVQQTEGELAEKFCRTQSDYGAQSPGGTGGHPCRRQEDVACAREHFRKCGKIRDAWHKGLRGSYIDGG